jgi:hypothetical protein
MSAMIRPHTPSFPNNEEFAMPSFSKTFPASLRSRASQMHANTPRQWRAARIQRFTQKQQRTREWINFAEIADWCSKEDHSIVPSEDKRAAAFDTLARDLLSGVFEENGRSRVLYLSPATTKARMTRAWLDDVIHHSYDNNGGRSEYLPHCWIPRRLFEGWLARNRLQESPSRFEPLVASTPLKNQKRGCPQAYNLKSQHARPNSNFGGGAKSIAIEQAIDQLWSNGIPKGLTAKGRNKAIISKMQENQSSLPTSPARAIQRVLAKRKNGTS